MQLLTYAIALFLAISSMASGFSLKVWDRTEFSGALRTYTTTGTRNLGFLADSYQWFSPENDGCCVRFCRGRFRSVGYQCTSLNQEDASQEFDRVSIRCGFAITSCLLWGETPDCEFIVEMLTGCTGKKTAGGAWNIEQSRIWFHWGRTNE